MELSGQGSTHLGYIPQPPLDPVCQPHQGRDRLVSDIIAGGRIVFDHLPIFHVQPPANAVDLPGKQQ